MARVKETHQAKLIHWGLAMSSELIVRATLRTDHDREVEVRFSKDTIQRWLDTLNSPGDFINYAVSSERTQHDGEG